MKLFTGVVFTEKYMVDFEHKVREYESVIKHLEKVQDDLERFTRYSKEDILILEDAEKRLIEYSKKLRTEVLKKCTEFNKALDDNHKYFKKGSEYLDTNLVKSKAEFKKTIDTLFDDYKQNRSKDLYDSALNILNIIIETENKKIANKELYNSIKEMSKKAQKLCTLIELRR